MWTVQQSIQTQAEPCHTPEGNSRRGKKIGNAQRAIRCLHTSQACCGMAWSTRGNDLTSVMCAPKRSGIRQILVRTWRWFMLERGTGSVRCVAVHLHEGTTYGHTRGSTPERHLMSVKFARRGSYIGTSCLCTVLKCTQEMKWKWSTHWPYIDVKSDWRDRPFTGKQFPQHESHGVVARNDSTQSSDSDLHSLYKAP